MRRRSGQVIMLVRVLLLVALVLSLSSCRSDPGADPGGSTVGPDPGADSGGSTVGPDPGPDPAGSTVGPEDLFVSDVLLSEGHVRRAAMVNSGEGLVPQAVYGEAALKDPLGGPMLVVGADYSEGPTPVPERGAPGFRALDLNGRPAVVGRDRAWTWVTWRLSPECVDECQGYVAGRNLAEGDVVAAARGATAERDAVSIADASLPRGMTLLFTGKMNLSNVRIATTQEVIWSPTAGEVHMFVAKDEGFALLLRFWIDGAPISVRGFAGSAGPSGLSAPDVPIEGRSWAEGGQTVLVIGLGVRSQDLDRFVGALRPARPGEWERMRARVLDVPAEFAVRTCAAPGQSIVTVDRREERYRWVFGFWSTRPDEAEFCHVILTPEDLWGHRPDRGLLYVKPDTLTITSLGLGAGRGPAGRFVMGVAPPGTDRVRLESESGGGFDALLTDSGPQPGYRYFGVFLEGDERNSRAPTIIALDRSGSELARAREGPP